MFDDEFEDDLLDDDEMVSSTAMKSLKMRKTNFTESTALTMKKRTKTKISMKTKMNF